MTDENKESENFVINVINIDNNDSNIIEVEKKDDEIIKRKRGRPRKPTPPPKERKPSLWRDDRHTYFNNYYKEKIMGNFFCPDCNKEFFNKYSLTKHSATNKACRIIKLERQLQVIEPKEN